tara:strand:+ start:429 stop:1172 length:744 start_codon:yes stop_codon:yes gene_type:complete
MSLRRGPGIITEGLIFYADAANPKSYVSGSTTTNNLTNLSEIGDLENGTSFSYINQGSWVFDGVDDFITFGDLTSINPELNSFTCNIFFKINPSTLTTNIILTKGNSSSTLIGWAMYYGDGNGTIEIRCNGNNTITQRAGQYSLINENQIYMVSLVINRTDNTIKGYLNGDNNGWNDGTSGGGFTSNSITGFGSITSSDDFFIGKRSNIGVPLPMFGDIYLVNCYNRALTQKEIQQNYNALKGRFGL